MKQNEIIEKLKEKVINSNNTHTIFDMNNYIKLDDAIKIVNDVFSERQSTIAKKQLTVNALKYGLKYLKIQKANLEIEKRFWQKRKSKLFEDVEEEIDSVVKSINILEQDNVVSQKQYVSLFVLLTKNWHIIETFNDKEEAEKRLNFFRKETNANIILKEMRVID